MVLYLEYVKIQADSVTNKETHSGVVLKACQLNLNRLLRITQEREIVTHFALIFRRHFSIDS